jgi:hypothetical protein
MKQSIRGPRSRVSLVTKGNEDKEGFLVQAEPSFCFLCYLLFRICPSNKSLPPLAPKETVSKWDRPLRISSLAGHTKTGL